MSKDLRFSLELIDSTPTIAKKILKAIAEEFNNRMLNRMPNIEYQIHNLTIQHIKATDTYDSLVNGELAAHFGLPSASRQGMVDSIVDRVANSIRIDFKPIRQFGKGFRGETTINILVRDFSDVLNLTDAFVSTEKGQLLPWLNWLLIQGDRLIISEYDINLVPGKGRSNMAVMIKDNAAAWRVPPQYAGTVANNWLTRAFKNNSKQYFDGIANILRRELQ